MDLNPVTELLKKRLLESLDTAKYYVKVENYSWHVILIVCKVNSNAHLSSIIISRVNECGNFSIGLPDYDTVEYISHGLLSGVGDESITSTVNNFCNYFNARQKGVIEDLKEDMDLAKDIMFKIGGVVSNVRFITRA